MKIPPISEVEGVSLFRVKEILILFILTFALGYSSSANAEGNVQKKWGFWALGGFSFTQDQAVGIGTASGMTGLSFGFGGEARLLPQFSLCMDILNIEKGYQTGTGSAAVSYSLKYLEFPVTIRYQPASAVAFRVGPYLGAFLLSATRDGQGVSSNIKGNFNNDFGVTLGGWFGFNPTPSMAVGLDLRFDYGLANILNNAQPATSVKTRSVISMATVTFYFK